MTITSYHSVDYPTLPASQPLEGTLLSIVTPEEIPSSGRVLINEPAGLFPTFSCIETGVELGALCGPTSGSKFLDAPSPEWVDGLAFGAYGVVLCKLESEDEIRAGVDEAYRDAEARTIERGAMRLMQENVIDNPGDPGYLPGSWAAAEDITPAALLATGGVAPVVGLGLLESHMAANYSSKGIMHTPRAVATVLHQMGGLEWNGSRLQTGLHTPVAAGPGYDLPNVGPDGDPAPDGSKWLYATGRMLIRKVSIQTRAMLNIFGQDADNGGPNYVPGLEPNDMVGLAESAYLVAVDCYKAAVLVKLYEEA